jgi:hypothetical protein
MRVRFRKNVFRALQTAVALSPARSIGLRPLNFQLSPDLLSAACRRLSPAHLSTELDEVLLCCTRAAIAVLLSPAPLSTALLLCFRLLYCGPAAILTFQLTPISSLRRRRPATAPVSMRKPTAPTRWRTGASLRRSSGEDRPTPSRGAWHPARRNF